MTSAQPAGLTKAYLELRDITVQDDGIIVDGLRKKIDFQFNPEKLDVGKSALWEFRKGAASADNPPVEYKGAKPTSITLEMFLDVSEERDGDVSADVQRLVEACIPTDKSQSRDLPLPPAVCFGWGNFYYEGYLETVGASYTMFRSNGKPIRAKCTLTLKELENVTRTRRQNPTSGSTGASNSAHVVEGDTLPGIAYRQYGDPKLWRAIAEVNGIDDPLGVQPGTLLVIPPALEAARMS